MRLSVTVRAALAACAALLVVLAPARPAWAHAQLLKTDPANGATVAGPLTAVTLTFNELVKQQFSTIVVTGADGVSYSDGTPRSVDKALTQPVKPLPGGAVRVAWRTVSADGHPVEGQFTFTNAATPATTESAAPAASSPPAPVTGSAQGPPGAAEPRSGPAGESRRLVWGVLGGVLLLAALAGGVYWRRRRSADRDLT
jgi:methionine-rich copper-binding protein CopC